MSPDFQHHPQRVLWALAVAVERQALARGGCGFAAELRSPRLTWAASVVKIDRQPEHGIAGGNDLPAHRIVRRKVAALDALPQPVQIVLHRPQFGQQLRALLGSEIIRVHARQSEVRRAGRQELNSFSR